MVAHSLHKNLQDQFLKIVSANPFLHKISNDKEYQEALELVESLMLDIGDNPDNPCWPLLEMVSLAITEYEDEKYPELAEAENESGIHMIRILMDKHGLSQKDLPEIGSQGVVSEILSGKRELNLRQVRNLSHRFGVDPAIFF